VIGAAARLPTPATLEYALQSAMQPDVRVVWFECQDADPEDCWYTDPILCDERGPEGVLQDILRAGNNVEPDGSVAGTPGVPNYAPLAEAIEQEVRFELARHLNVACDEPVHLITIADGSTEVRIAGVDPQDDEHHVLSFSMGAIVAHLIERRGHVSDKVARLYMVCPSPARPVDGTLSGPVCLPLPKPSYLPRWNDSDSD
jgi:hypothetical protein